MKNFCKTLETIDNYEEQFNYLRYIEGLILSDGSKDFIMKDGLNSILASKGEEIIRSKAFGT